MMRKSKSKKVRNQATDLAGLIGPTVESARDKAGPLIADARDKAGPVIAEAREKAGPVLNDARDKAGPVISDARDRFSSEVLPVISAAVAAASEATEDVRGESKKRGKAAVAALKGDVEAPEPKKHRVRKVLIILGLGGIIAAVAKKLSDRPASTTWQSSYTPPPAPSSPGAAGAAGAAGGAHKADDESEDQGGSSPDVAAADAAAEPHEATTPDDPAETVDVKKKS